MPLSADTRNRLVVATALPTAGAEVADALDAARVALTGDVTTNAANVATLAATSANVPLSTSPTKGIGYAAGAGGVITQLTDKSTSVALNKASGQITMNNAALAAAAEVKFSVTCAQIGVGDVVIVNHASAGTAGSYLAQACNIQAGVGYDIVVSNVSAGSLSEAIVLNVVVVKGVIA